MADRLLGFVVTALQRVDEAEPAHEVLLGPVLGLQPPADGLAVEEEVEPHAEHATLVGAGLIVDDSTLSAGRRHRLGEHPDLRPLVRPTPPSFVVEPAWRPVRPWRILPCVAVEAPTTLLERDRELVEIEVCLSDAREGGGRVVVVEASAGLGKTTLLRTALELADDAGFICLRARATELERDFAYGCVRQLLEPVVTCSDEDGREALFEGAAGLVRCLFAPADVTESPPADAFGMLHGLYWLLANVADQRPVVIVVDDLHWADAESLSFLNYLAPRLDGLPVAVLGGTRSGESLTPDLVRLCAAPETTLLRPAPLSITGTAQLCERRLGAAVAPEFALACREATGGNPFFLEALLLEASEQMVAPYAAEAKRVRGIAPATVARAVLLRLSGRPASATALVRAVAVLGDGTSLGEAAELAGLREDEAARAADLLIALAILKPGDGLEFAHPIVRESVSVDIGAHERAVAHARAARILSERGAPEERIAAQIAGAEPAGDAARVELLRRVAADALGRGAPAAAVAWLRRALAEPPEAASRVGVLLELGAAELRLGAPDAVDHLRRRSA